MARCDRGVRLGMILSHSRRNGCSSPLREWYVSIDMSRSWKSGKGTVLLSSSVPMSLLGCGCVLVGRLYGRDENVPWRPEPCERTRWAFGMATVVDLEVMCVGML